MSEDDTAGHGARLHAQARFLLDLLKSKGTVQLGPEASELLAWMSGNGWVEVERCVDGGLKVQLKKR